MDFTCGTHEFMSPEMLLGEDYDELTVSSNSEIVLEIGARIFLVSG